jgi:hypothetical protein
MDTWWGELLEYRDVDELVDDLLPEYVATAGGDDRSGARVRLAGLVEGDEPTTAAERAIVWRLEGTRRVSVRFSR